MRHLARFEPITVEQFLAFESGDDRKYELVDGAIRLLAGVVRGHARISVNLLCWLGDRLRGTGFRPYSSGLALRTGEVSCRFPDVAVYPGAPFPPERDGDRLLDDPVVLIDISASADPDAEHRLAEYRSLPSVDTILLVDPVAERVRVIQRLGPTSWRDDLLAAAHDVELPALGLVVPHAEIFARD